VTIHWTDRAQDDLAAIHAFIEADSTHYAAVTVRRLIKAVDRLQAFPHSGRAVPEFEEAEVREVILRPYRIVYRIVSTSELHVLTVHHGSRETLGAI
jgi:toxin ParE1/3/4